MSADVSRLTDHEMDAWIAENVMEYVSVQQPLGILYRGVIHFWRRPDGRVIPKEEWRPSTDRNAARLVLDKIASLGLVDSWCGHFMHNEWNKSSAFVWIAAIAPARQLMEAVYLAWEGART